jgi:hypothetical protein
MGFLDKAMKTANELAGKAETMLAQSGVSTPGQGGADRVYAELGRLVHDEHRGRAADPGRRAELLRQLDAMADQAASAPPPPGAPPPPHGSTAPPAPGSGMPPSPGTTAPPAPGSGMPPSPGTTEPPPPGGGTSYGSPSSHPAPPPPPPPPGS